MQVNNTEINGFLIDQFNQHDLEVGATQGICPLCSHSRKPEHKKAKCSSYDWERGLGTCHNCDKSYQIHTYQRKGASEKVYARPDDPTIKPLHKKVVDWFASREIFLNLIEEEFPELEEQRLRGLCELFENALADQFAFLNEK